MKPFILAFAVVIAVSATALPARAEQWRAVRESASEAARQVELIDFDSIRREGDLVRFRFQVFMEPPNFDEADRLVYDFEGDCATKSAIRSLGMTAYAGRRPLFVHAASEAPLHLSGEAPALGWLRRACNPGHVAALPLVRDPATNVPQVFAATRGSVMTELRRRQGD